MLMTAGATLVLAPGASAHVSVQPSEAPAQAFVREDVRVPNEQDKASTTKVQVQLPDGFADASYQPVPGWTVKVTKEKLAQPIKNDEGEEITEQVKRITWSGGEIAPGEFQDFPLSVQIPDEAGSALTFKAIQTYDNGDVVRWIGAPDAEEPAPQVKVTAASESEPATTPANDEGDDEDDDSNTLAIIALVVGALGLLAGGAAFATRRRTT
jgi:MYXO-CTERM domain-containing protein